jgi:hypothetical protein
MFFNVVRALEETRDLFNFVFLTMSQCKSTLFHFDTHCQRLCLNVKAPRQTLEDCVYVDKAMWTKAIVLTFKKYCPEPKT